MSYAEREDAFPVDFCISEHSLHFREEVTHQAVSSVTFIVKYYCESLEEENVIALP